MSEFQDDHLVHFCPECGWIGGTNQLADGTDCPDCGCADLIDESDPVG